MTTKKTKPAKQTKLFTQEQLKQTSYKTPRYQQSTIRVNTSTQGETLESKIERIISNKEPIKDGAPIMYTERKDGVLASTNIKTDRFEVAIDAMTKVEKSYKARREERATKAKEAKDKKDSGAEPIQGKPEVGN